MPKKKEEIVECKHGTEIRFQLYNHTTYERRFCESCDHSPVVYYRALLSYIFARARACFDCIMLGPVTVVGKGQHLEVTGNIPISIYCNVRYLKS